MAARKPQSLERVRVPHCKLHAVFSVDHPGRRWDVWAWSVRGAEKHVAGVLLCKTSRLMGYRVLRSGEFDGPGVDEYIEARRLAEQGED